MKFKKYFSNNTVSSSTGAQAETRSGEPSSQSNPQPGQTADENPEPSPSPVNAASTSGIQAALVDSSTRLDRALTIPQSIIPGTPSDQISSANESSRADPALDDTAKFISALQALSGMALPLGLPQVAKSASQLLTSLDAERSDDAGVRVLILDISKIIIGLVIWTNPTATTEQENVVAKVISYLNTLHAFCEVKRGGGLFSSEWKEKIEGVRREVQELLPFVSTTDIEGVLAEPTSVAPAQQPIQETPQETSLDQSFQDVEFLNNPRVRINNFVRSGLDQSRPIPPNRESSRAFKGAKFGGGDIFINNHSHNFGSGPW